MTAHSESAPHQRGDHDNADSSSHALVASEVKGVFCISCTLQLVSAIGNFMFRGSEL